MLVRQQARSRNLGFAKSQKGQGVRCKGDKYNSPDQVSIGDEMDVGYWVIGGIWGNLSVLGCLPPLTFPLQVWRGISSITAFKPELLKKQLPTEIRALSILQRDCPMNCRVNSRRTRLRVQGSPLQLASLSRGWQCNVRYL